MSTNPALPTDWLLSVSARFRSGRDHPVPAGCGSFHAHSAFEIVYHRSGCGTVTTEGGVHHEFNPGGVEIIPSDVRHAQRQSVAGHDFCIDFDLPNVSRPIGPMIPQNLSGDEFPSTELLALSRLPLARDAAEQRIRDCRLTAILVHLLRSSGVAEMPAAQRSASDDLAQRAREYLCDNWRAVRTVDHVAQAMNVSGDYLRHAFRRRFGQTLHDLLTQLRIEHAQKLLVNTSLPQKAIADVCGFADAQQLSRRFRQITGKTPGDFRSTAGRASL
jgi:AraC-like DNA-binding protein